MRDLLELPNNWVNKFNGLNVLKCVISADPFSPWTANDNISNLYPPVEQWQVHGEDKGLLSHTCGTEGSGVSKVRRKGVKNK